MEKVLKLKGTQKLVEGLKTLAGSFGDISSRIQSAIQAKISAGVDMDLDDDGPEDMNCYCWVSAVYSDVAVYSMEGNYFMIPYTDDGANISLGTPVAVEMAYIDKVTPSKAEESHRVSLSGALQLTEAAAYNATKGTLTVRVIQPGFNKGKDKYYPAEMLRRDYKVFEGAKMFANHQTEADAEQRPEGDINAWVASLTKVWAEKDGTLMGEAQVIDPPFKAKLATLAEKNLLTDMGISIRAIGEGSKQTIDGYDTVCIESILKSRSVDFVTYAGAGGRVEAIESASEEQDVELISEAKLREKRPDLITLIESKKEASIMKSVEEQLKEANDQLAEANKKIAATEKANRQAVAGAAISTLLTESKLPEVAVNRLKAQFKEAEDVKGVAEAISAEAEYIKSLAPAPVKNNGADDNASISEADATKSKATMVESYKRLGLSESEAKVAAGA